MATKKKTQQPVEEAPISAPLFVKHHYLILESSDGERFFVDRNAAATSKLIAAALVELGNRADEEVGDINDDLAAAAEDGIVGGGGATADGAPSSSSSFFILRGDVEVKANGEKAANAAAQLPIVHPSILVAAAMAQQRPMTGDGAAGGGGGGRAAGGGGGSAAKSLGSKAAQHMIAQQEAMAQQLALYHHVEASAAALASLPLTHLRLAHLTAPMVETAVRFMYYKYKNDHVTDAELRQGFFALVSGRSHPPPPPQQQQQQQAFGMSASFGAFGEAGRGGFAPPSVSPTKQRKSAAAANLLAAAAAAANGPPVDPITGGGITQVPAVGSQAHMLFLSVSLLLQL